MKKHAGFLSLVTVALIVIFGFLGIAVTYMFVGSTMSSLNFQLSAKALYIAESGLQAATRALQTSDLTGSNPRIDCSSVTSNAALTNSTILGAGTAFTVTGGTPTYVSSPSTLNGILNATATSIPMVSTSGYASAGRLMLDTEEVNYQAISGNDFIGVTRGIDNTTAVIHPSGTRVGQFQCALTAVGGLPDLTTPTNKRTLQDKIQLQEGWIVGNTSGANQTFGRWNQPTERAWNNASVAGAFSLNGVYMLSYADGWAVGASGTFLRWNGSSWVSVATGLSDTYQSVFCNANNDCHAVANHRRFGHWDGSTWTSISATGSLAATNLTSIHCDSTSDCWAVGSGAGGGKFYHWTGAGWTGIDVSAIFTTSYPFNGVYCTSASNCWAVGLGTTFGHYTGSWAAVTTAGLPNVQYNNIFCNSANDCWAVGNLNGANDVIVHYDGTSWTDKSVSLGTAVNLLGLTCVNAKDCWAVGSSTNGVLHYDGTSWSIFATSLPAGVTLNNVSMVSPHTQPQSDWVENFP